jgi:hypothetical protein
MSDSLDTTIAKALKTALQAASDAESFSQEFTAERIYFPLFDPEKTRTLRVVVVQKDYLKQIAAKAIDLNTINLHVVIAKPIPQVDATTEAATTAIDELRYFTEEIMEWLLRQDLGNAVGTIVEVGIGGEGQIMDASAMVSNHLYLAPIQVTVQLNS